MKDECFGVNTGSEAKQNPFCDVKDVVGGAHMALTEEFQQARRELSPDKFKVLQNDERAWIKDTLTPTQKGPNASSFDELDTVNARTKLVHDWRTAPKDSDGAEQTTPAEKLQNDAKALEEKSQNCTTFDCAKDAQAGWETIVNQAYAKTMEDATPREGTGISDNFVNSLRAEQEQWEKFRQSSFQTIDDRFGIDESKPGQTERDISEATNNVGTAIDKSEIVMQRAKHLLGLYSEMTGPGE